MARKHVEEWIIKFLDDLTHTKDNSELLKKEVLSKLKTDKAFSQWIDDLESGKKKITIIVPPNTDTHLSIESCKKLAKSMNHDFYQYLYISSNDDDIPPYKTNEKYMIVDQSVMRLSQFSNTSIKHSSDNDSVDDLTKQPRGSSEGASITHPELQILGGLGLKAPLHETFKSRGGDAGEFRAMNASLANKGHVSLREVAEYSTGVGSTALVDVYFKGIHIRMT